MLRLPFHSEEKRAWVDYLVLQKNHPDAIRTGIDWKQWQLTEGCEDYSKPQLLPNSQEQYLICIIPEYNSWSIEFYRVPIVASIICRLDIPNL